MKRWVSCVAVLGFAVLGVACDTSHPSHPATPARAVTPAQTANAFALTMLDSVNLPAGATPYVGTTPAILASAVDTPAVSNLVKQYRMWTAPEPSSRLRFFKFTPPSHGFDHAGGSGYMQTRDGKAWTFEAQFVNLPKNVALAQLDVAVTGAPGGGSVIRASALVSWTAPKPAAELVPATDRVAIVTALHPSDPPSVFLRVVVTDPKQFASLAASFNRMRLAAKPAFQECGSSPILVPDLGAYAGRGTIHEIAFSTSAHAKPDVIVAGVCGGVGVRAHGKLQPTLQYDKAFDAAVTKIFFPNG